MYLRLIILLLLILGGLLIYTSLQVPTISYQVLTFWNQYLNSLKSEQNNKGNYKGVPSMSLASEGSNPAAQKLDFLIKQHHDQIIKEVILAQSQTSGLPMSEFDPIQNKWLGGRKEWSPIWIKFYSTWARDSRYFPTIRSIVEQIPEVSLIHISVMNPGAELPRHRGINSSVWRYHYGLIIPDGETAIEIEGVKYKWKVGEGVIWDDTLYHQAYNRSSEPRIIIFADVQREMNPIYRFISNSLSRLLEESKDVKEIQDKLTKDHIRLD